jgi:hypothetical protein
MDNGMNVWWLEFPFWTSCWKALLEDAYGDYGCLMTLVFFGVWQVFVVHTWEIGMGTLWNLVDRRIHDC